MRLPVVGSSGHTARIRDTGLFLLVTSLNPCLIIILCFCSGFRPFIIFEYKGAGGAGADALVTFLAHSIAHRLIGKGSNHPLEAAAGKAKETYSQALSAYPYAPSTEHTFVGVIGEHGVAIIYGKVPQ